MTVETDVRIQKLRFQLTPKHRGKRRVIPSGFQFGRWTVLVEMPQRTSNRRVFSVSCECGVEKEILLQSLLCGDSQSCGCLHADRSRDAMQTHGQAKHPLYSTWQGMIARCTNPRDRFYHAYGGRGITVCTEWIESPAAFFSAVGPKPFPQATIDRINNSLGYQPGNVRWASPTEQMRNTRSNVWVETPNGRVLLSDAAKNAGLKRETVFWRYRQGLPIDQVLSPTRKYKPR